ncbi:MAG: sulfotransferase family 2 domain-containing protein [Gammaproteobacteria bacterium]|nr:sulfotransferase family 2 domain-containing protein [Gammaproteobacteria bacterium]
MIVSHRHRFMFFAVPRTGTHAVREALRWSLGEEDWQQQSLTERVQLPVPALARVGHGHLTLGQVRAHLPKPMCRDYFKFAFVRNPYDRFVSVCAMLNRRNPDYRGRETGFMKRAIREPRFQARALVRPQRDMLVDAGGELGMDFIGRFENLQRSFGEACRRIGIPERDLARSNATEHRDYTSYYDDELLGLVNDFYRPDFDSLGYEISVTAKTMSCA